MLLSLTPAHTHIRARAKAPKQSSVDVKCTGERKEMEKNERAL